MAKKTTPRLLSTPEAAERLGVHHSLIRRWASEGWLPGQKIGSNWAFTEADLDEFERKRITPGQLRASAHRGLS